MTTCTCTHIYSEASAQAQLSFLALFSETGSLASEPGLAVQQAPGIPPALPLQQWNYRHMPPHLVFHMWVLALELMAPACVSSALLPEQAPNRPFIKLAQQYTIGVGHVLPAGTSLT